MTKKEVKLIRDCISDFNEALADEEFRKELSDDQVRDLEARIDVLEWLLEATGYL